MVNFVQDIIDFQTKFGLEYKGPPRQLPEDLETFRRKFMMEELIEYAHACEHRDKVGMLDGLVDLLYVAFGTAHLHGFDIQKAWARVHEANMKKVRALRESDSKRGSTYDVIKPEGWKPPDLSDLV